MPLSTAEEAAWAATLALKRGSKTLPPALQTSLVAFFKANDLGVLVASDPPPPLAPPCVL